MNDIEETTLHQIPEVTPDATVAGCPPDVSSRDGADGEKRWYVMRSTYCRELKATKMLAADGVECYVPMKTVRTEQGATMQPAVHNLVFVRTDREFMDRWKRRHEEDCPLRYTIDRATSLPMVVRDKAMEDFIRVTRDCHDGIIYLDNPQVAVERGKKIEIVYGQYTGIRGSVLRILRDRKVVVGVNGLVAVAINGIPFAWMKEI